MQLGGRLLLALALVAPAMPERSVALDVRAEPTAERSEGDLLESFRRVFAGEPSTARSAQPEKCVTQLVRDFDASRAGLSPTAIRTIEAWFLGNRAADVRVLETTHFRFEYATDGAHAVPAEDIAPADGVPDFVANLGVWAEMSWSALVDDAGFTQPLVRDGRVDVAFQAMSAFGYSRLVAGAPALVLHCNYVGFPDNDDPDGSSAGAAKVTIAHELKHALQYAASGWTEGGWLEADATWAEDIVFDATNDYVRMIQDGSPITDPAQWLPASYEDCLFPRLLSERHGTAVLVDFFARRSVARAEPVLTSFDITLRGHGSSLRAELAQLGLWTWFCGANAEGRPTGFAEATSYPTPPIAAHVEARYDARLASLGTHHHLATAAGRSGTPRVAFAAESGAPFAVWSVLLDRAGRRTYQSIPLAGLSSVEIARPWEELATLTLIVSHVAVGTSPTNYGVAVDADPAVGVDPSAAGSVFALHPNRPNPFRHETSIAFTLPAPAQVRLSIYDVSGRLVRVLDDGGARPSGTHSIVWDARDSTGQRVAPGMYASRLEAGDQAAIRKMLLVR